MAAAGNFPHIEPLPEDGGINERLFHGTNLEDAKNIVANGFQTSRSKAHYLGDGVYFFEDQFEEALAWANNWHGKRPPVAVIKATVRYGKCLNLLGRVYQEAVHKLSNVLKTRANQLGQPAPSETSVINALANRLNADTVRAAYRGSKAPRNPQYRYSFDVDLQMIVCVRNLQQIARVEIVHPSYPTAV